MLEICFDANLYAKLHELKITSNLNIGKIIRFPDFISVGDINPFLITNRNKMLSDFDIPDSKDYQCNWNLFYQEIKKENGFRFWISKYAYEYAGMCYICSIIDSQIITICNTETVDSFSNYCMNELYSIEQYKLLFQLQYSDDSSKYSSIWNQLSKENKPLRFTKDGTILSVDENYFDQEIIKYMNINKTPLENAINAQTNSMILKESKIGIYFIIHRINYLKNQCFMDHSVSNKNYND